MAKTINFCGDSFCASPKPDSWVVRLSESLDTNIVGLGESGSARLAKSMLLDVLKTIDGCVSRVRCR